MDRKETPPETEKQTAQTPSRRRKMAKLKEGLHKLPDRKPQLDFIAGLLTIPLLLVTLILNFNNLTGKNTAAKSSLSPSPSITAAPTIIYKTIGGGGNITPLVVTTKPQPTSPDQCIQDIGPISIANPSEGQTVSDNPVCIDINYQAGNYCGVVWAYKINGGPLSDYSNNSVCYNNLPNGNNTFELHVKSLVSSSTQTLTRNFIYKGAGTPTPTLTATPTATPIPTQTQ